MLYTSPFEILDLPTAELQQMDRKMLQLKKKQLMAELQLQSSGVVTLSGKEFTKNDIVLLFEQLEQDDTIAMHAAIAADPALLQFLQTGKINPGQKFNYNPLYQEEAFIDFVSPFYKEAFNRHVLKALAVSDFSRIEGVFGNPVLLNGEDYDISFGKLHAYLEEKLHGIQVLKESFAVDKRTDLRSLHDYYIYDWVNTLNKLPDDFANFRDDYAIDLYNFAVDLWNGHKKDEARAMLYGIQSIHCSPRSQKLITDLIEQVSAVQQTTSSGSGSSYNAVWVIVAVIIMIIRLGVTCNRSSSSNQRYDFSDLLQKSNSYNNYSYRNGFAPFKPVNKRDRAMLDFLNTLRQSTITFTTKVPDHVALTQGSDPFRDLFSKGAFKPLLTETKASTTTKEDEKDISIQDAEVREAESISIVPGKSAIDINNKIGEETIVFFYSKEFVTSVYLKANSSYTVSLPNGSYYAFCYSGSQFSKNMPLKIPSTAYTGAKKDFATIGRFIEPHVLMLPYLLPKKNLHFMAGNPNTSITTNAVITVDLGDDNHFDMQSGKGVTALKTLLVENNNVVD